MGTLGRQETMGGEDDYPEVARQGRFIANGILRGLAHARPITSTALGGAEQYIAVPAHNAALLALLALNATGPNCGNPTGDCAIDRSLEPPYLAGNVIGTWVTGLRIGDVAWVSEPGEAFNEVSQAVRAAVGGARQVNVVGMAQDQLGYYYPPEDYPASELNPSDYILFNVSPSLADESVDASAVVATELGFNGQPSHPMMDDENPQAFFHAGTQFYPSVVESADPQRDFLVGDATSQAPGAPTQPAHTATPAVIDFGDGTPAVTISGDEQRISHTFPGPGRYSVTSTTTDETGYERSYTAWVIVDRTPQAIVRRVVRGGRALYTAAVRGGDGHALAAHWTFADGGGADGLTVTRPAGAPAPAVTVVDGAGDTASG
jgi:hypothetical protein